MIIGRCSRRKDPHRFDVGTREKVNHVDAAQLNDVGNVAVALAGIQSRPQEKAIATNGAMSPITKRIAMAYTQP